MFLACAAYCCAAKDKSKAVKTIIKSWQLPLPVQQADTVAVDTSMINLPMSNHLNRYSISNCWNANTVSPVQSRIYFDRTKGQIDDVFGQQYAPYLITGENVRFYNTTVPYSKISYSRGFTNEHEEHELNFLFTGNINRRLNLGLELNYLTAAGHYMSQQGKLFNGSVFGSYNGDHYSLHAAVTFNSLSNFENGGIQRDSDLVGSLNAPDIPIRNVGMSGYRYITGLLNQSYSITAERKHIDSIEVTNDFGEKEMRDTVHIEYIPLLTFMHTFETSNSVRRYRESNTMQYYLDQNNNYCYFYDHYPYRNSEQTRDSSNVLTIRNTVSVTFEEEFNKLLRFGAKAYVYNEFQRFLTPTWGSSEAPYASPVGNDFGLMTSVDRAAWVPDTAYSPQWTNNTFVGGTIYKNTGRFIRYGAIGDVCLVGYKIGQFHVDGHVDADFRVGKDTMYISARAYVKNETPTYYQQHYYSNHYRWDNDFTKIYRYGVGARLAYPTQWVKPRIDFGFEDVQNYIYYQDGMPRQHDGHIQIFAGDLGLDITTPWVNLENNIIYQHSSSACLPLPDITLYHNLYYHGWWARGAMQAQMGVDMRYFSRYYAPVLSPATGQFCVQNETKVGNYPVLNVYLNFYVKLLHLKFFAAYTHFNHLFMKENMNNFIMPGYPNTPDQFRAGLSWHFYR